MIKRDINVGVIGFSLLDQSRLKRTFQYSRSNNRSYVFSDVYSDSIDILMVNINTGEVRVQQQDFLQKHPETPVVTAGLSQPANGSRYHIQGPLISTRVLKVLEQIEIPEPKAKITAETVIYQETAGSTPQQVEQNQAENSYDILVVDDSPSMQKALELQLKQVPVSLNIDFADSGEQALERVRQKIYHVIFLDIMMPGIDGFETCTTIRTNPEMKKTPIIMLSAKTSPLDEVKGVMAGCTTYLTKPIVHDDFQKLIKRIMEWLENFQLKYKDCSKPNVYSPRLKGA